MPTTGRLTVPTRPPLARAPLEWTLELAARFQHRSSGFAGLDDATLGQVLVVVDVVPLADDSAGRPFANAPPPSLALSSLKAEPSRAESSPGPASARRLRPLCVFSASRRLQLLRARRARQVVGAAPRLGLGGTRRRDWPDTLCCRRRRQQQQQQQRRQRQQRRPRRQQQPPYATAERPNCCSLRRGQLLSGRSTGPSRVSLPNRLPPTCNRAPSGSRSPTPGRAAQVRPRPEAKSLRSSDIEHLRPPVARPARAASQSSRQQARRGIDSTSLGSHCHSSAFLESSRRLASALTSCEPAAATSRHLFRNSQPTMEAAAGPSRDEELSHKPRGLSGQCDTNEISVMMRVGGMLGPAWLGRATCCSARQAGYDPRRDSRR